MITWTTDIPKVSGYYYVKLDLADNSWAAYCVDASAKMVYYGTEGWSFEDFKDFQMLFGSKIPPPGA